MTNRGSSGILFLVYQKTPMKVKLENENK